MRNKTMVDLGRDLRQRYITMTVRNLGFISLIKEDYIDRHNIIRKTENHENVRV